MRVPTTINLNTLKEKIISNTIKSDKIKSYDFSILDKVLPKSLQEICIETIAKNWTENPILEEILLTTDQCHLLEILPTDLPLKLTVERIHNDIYWKKCYEEKWPYNLPQNVADINFTEIVRPNGTTVLLQSNPSSEKSSRRSSKTLQPILKNFQLVNNSNLRTWKEFFIEQYIKNYLEKLKPEDYNPEEMKQLSDICGPYVHCLTINQLECAETSSNKIPLNAILGGFANLTELSINYKQTYVGDKFSWNILQINDNDIKLLAKGLEKLNLKIFRIQNSDVDCPKLLIILKSLLKHHQLELLDFSHCKIGDKGALALSKLILQGNLTELILTNNFIGLKGIEGLTYAMQENDCKLKSLNLRLNSDIGEEGGNILMKSLPFCDSLSTLYLSGCGLTKNVALPQMLKANYKLKFLDICNNKLEDEIGRGILAVLDENKTIKNLDCRMCQISGEIEAEIQAKILQNVRSKLQLEFPKEPDIATKENLDKAEIMKLINEMFEDDNMN